MGIHLTGSKSISEFTELLDVPDDYAGAGNFVVKVTSAEDGLEFGQLVAANIAQNTISLDKLIEIDSQRILGRDSDDPGNVEILSDLPTSIAALYGKLAQANTWSAAQSFDDSVIISGLGSSAHTRLRKWPAGSASLVIFEPISGDFSGNIVVLPSGTEDAAGVGAYNTTNAQTGSGRIIMGIDGAIARLETRSGGASPVPVTDLNIGETDLEGNLARIRFMFDSVITAELQGTRTIFNRQVGIGTGAPSAQLFVYVEDSSNPLSVSSTDKSNAAIRFGATVNRQKGGIFFDMATDGLSWDRGDIVFATNNSTSNSTVAMTNGRMWIKSNGHVGVNASDPTFGLVQINQAGNGVNGGLALLDSTGAKTGRLWLDDTNFYVYSGSGQNPLILNNTGNVGVGGAPTVSAKLDIQGTDGAVLFPRLTSAQRDVLIEENGMVIYNTSQNKLQAFASGVWNDLH